MMNGRDKIYFSTQEAAVYCRVTRFTIINWVKQGLIKATRTAGGHRRIARNELMVFMRTNNMDIKELSESNGLKSPENGFKWCWEYYQNDGYKNHKCRGCLVYLTHSKKCFDLRKRLGNERVFCNSDCEHCSYYREYYGNFDWCWEYHQEGRQDGHKCRECMGYLTGTKKCYALREETDHKKIYCSKDCSECSYYKKHVGTE